MSIDLANFAKDKGVKYFMISYTDLLVASAPSWFQRRPLPTCRLKAQALPALRPGLT